MRQIHPPHEVHDWSSPGRNYASWPVSEAEISNQVQWQAWPKASAQDIFPTLRVPHISLLQPSSKLLRNPFQPASQTYTKFRILYQLILIKAAYRPCGRELHAQGHAQEQAGKITAVGGELIELFDTTTGAVLWKCSLKDENIARQYVSPRQ